MRRARLADFLHRLKASVLRGGTDMVIYHKRYKIIKKKLKKLFIFSGGITMSKENYLLMVFAKLKIAKRTKIWGMQIYDDEKTNIKR